MVPHGWRPLAAHGDEGLQGLLISNACPARGPASPRPTQSSKSAFYSRCSASDMAAASNATEALLLDGVLGGVSGLVGGGSGTALLVAKVTGMVVLGVVSMLVGLLPIKLAKWMRWSTDSEVVKNTEVSA